MIYIRKGDEVYSRDEKTGETSLKEVIEIFRTSTHTVYHIWAGGKEKFKTTAYHPVYVKEQGWVIAINLRKGDTIETMNGFVHITKVEKTRHEEAIQVYNFHVKDWTSFFVGKIKCYVHNDERTNHNNLISKVIGNGITCEISDKALKDVKKKWGQKGVDAFKKAMDKGIVGPEGQNGIKQLKGKPYKGKYTHEIKVKNKEYANYRIYGYKNTNGNLIFDYFAKGLH
ncbi:MAG: hypothetical protein HFH67_16730 [Lachnospiraceae bacterium]|nr:hypothetical protein [Lachnospiraceae bacterium]